jgi:hypothetical protein
LRFIISAEKIRIINLTTAKSLVKHYAAVFSVIIATLLFSGFVCQADAADLKALLVPSTNRTEASYIGVRTVTLTYPAGSPLAQMLDGENKRINFSLNGTTAAQDETGMSQAIGSINRALAEAKSPAQVSSCILQYNAVIRGEPTRTLISYKVEIKPTLEKYVLSSDSSGNIIDLEWRGIVVNDAIVVNAPEIGEIDVNHALGLLQALYPSVAEKLASTQAKEILEEPILNFKVFDFPMASWHQLFDPVGTYGGGVGLQGTEGASVLSVYAYGEGSLREGVHTAEEKDVTVNIDGYDIKVHSNTPPPSGQITVAGYSNEQESEGAEFALVTLNAPAGVQTSSGGFPIQVLLVLGGMMGAVAIFVLLKARK